MLQEIKKQSLRIIIFIGIVIALCIVFLFIQRQVYMHSSALSDTDTKQQEKDTTSVTEVTVTLLSKTAVTVVAEVVADPISRKKGLSNRPQLPSNRGMLFIFPTPGRYGIWMKEMRFPIDIIWISGDKTVTGIVTHANPSSYPNVFKPSIPSLYVLEVPAGFTEKHSINIGTQVDF